jgi:hypothetical protein
MLDVLRRVDQILQTVDGQSQAQNQTSGSTAPSFQFQGIVFSQSVLSFDDYFIRYIYRRYYVAFVVSNSFPRLENIMPLNSIFVKL